MSISTVATIHGQGLLSARPAVSAAPLGSLYYATDTQLVYRNNGTTWDTWTPAAGAPSGSAGGDLANTYPNPTLSQQSARLPVKEAVRVASTANVTVASGLENGDTLDGVTLATGDRVLLKDQTAGAENGIYVVVASGAASRATDADSAAEMLAGFQVYVKEGTAGGGKTYVHTTSAAITLGTTALTFAALGSGGSVATDAIWDAAGDLAVGSGANTAARLAIAGTDGHVLTRVAGAVAWAAPSGGGSLTTASTNLGSDVGLATGGWTDVLSLSLAAGTWLVWGVLTANGSSTQQSTAARITDGTTTYAAANGTYSFWLALPAVSEPIVLGGTTTIKLQGYPEISGQSAKASGLSLVGTPSKVTHLRALKVA